MDHKGIALSGCWGQEPCLLSSSSRAQWTEDSAWAKSQLCHSVAWGLKQVASLGLKHLVGSEEGESRDSPRLKGFF